MGVVKLILDSVHPDMGDNGHLQYDFQPLPMPAQNLFLQPHVLIISGRLTSLSDQVGGGGGEIVIYIQQDVCHE